MLHFRKIAVLAALAAIAWAPTGANAILVSPKLPTGPLSIVMSCSTGASILNLGSQEFDLTDVTIANTDTSSHSVAISNTFTSGVGYEAAGNSTVMQKFETPIRFVGAVNSPHLFCDSTTTLVTVSLQGIVP